MKVSIITLICILSTATFVQSQHGSLSNQQMKELEGIVKDKKWSSIIMNLAELHLMAQGPIEQLRDAVLDVDTDLKQKLENTKNEYNKRSHEHENESRRLKELIRQVDIDVAAAQEHLTNVLVPQKNQLNEDIVILNHRVEARNEFITSETARRIQSHKDFETRVEEHNGIFQAIEEALTLLSNLEEAQISLVQVKSMKQSLENIEKKIRGRDIDASLVEALISLSSEKFSDQSSVKKVIDLLVSIREKLQISYITEKQNEEQEQKTFEEQTSQAKLDISNALQELDKNTKQLGFTEQSIADSHTFIEQRTSDKVGQTKDLLSENESFDAATALYNELVAQFESELNACQQVIGILEHLTIQDYISSRVGTQTVLIDQSHTQKFGQNE